MGSCTAHAAASACVGRDGDRTGNRHLVADAEVQLVLRGDRRARSRRYAGRTVVRTITINIHGLTQSTIDRIYIKICSGCITTCIVIHGHQKVADTVIFKWGVEIYGCPSTGSQRYGTRVQYSIGSTYTFPVSTAGELRLIGMLQIDIVGSGLCTTAIIERYTADRTCPTNLARSIDLLRITIVIERGGWKVTVSGTAAATDHSHIGADERSGSKCNTSPSTLISITHATYSKLIRGVGGKVRKRV